MDAMCVKSVFSVKTCYNGDLFTDCFPSSSPVF